LKSAQGVRGYDPDTVVFSQWIRCPRHQNNRLVDQGSISLSP
jgi:hypothetical protein